MLNQLTELDLTANTKLAYLLCNNNKLTRIKLGESKLVDVTIEDNQIKAKEMQAFFDALPDYSVKIPERENPTVVAVKTQSETEGWLVRDNADLNNGIGIDFAGLPVAITHITGAADQPKIHFADSRLVIADAQAQAAIVLYDVAGRKIAAGQTDSEGAAIIETNVADAGVYIVMIGGNAYSIIL